MSDQGEPQQPGLLCGVTYDIQDSTARLLKTTVQLEEIHTRVLGPVSETCGAKNSLSGPDGEIGDLVTQAAYLDATVNRLAELVGRMSRI